MNSASDRWPPIVAALAAAVLIFLVLPNPLSIPQTNPSAAAEYAPVPGKTDQQAAANFSETSTATSAGIGAGGEGVGPLPGRRTPPQPIFEPSQLPCVGNPPRQTEDELSPPCVPSFKGDNGGNTFKGVTKDEIVVVLYNDRCCNGMDLTTPYKPSDEGSCDGPATAPWECDNLVRTLKAHYQYFTARYQTYERRVRLIGQNSSAGVAGSCASRQGDAKSAIRDYEPFAVVWLAQGNAFCYAQEMASNKIPIMGLNEDLPENLYSEFRPYSFGFMPSQEVQGEWSATFLCQKLVGRTAKYANDLLLQGELRTFGLIKPQDASVRDAERVEMADLLEKEAEACGLEWADVRTYSTRDDFSVIMERFKSAGITTVVCQCTTFREFGPRSATNIAYFPEWYWDSPTYMDRGIWMRTEGSAEQAAFGTTYFWRVPAFRSQHHYRAFNEIEPGAQPNVFFSYRSYHLFLNLYQAIQAAGPRLTPATVEQGMFTFNYTNEQNPGNPVGGYGPYSDRAISNYTFVDTGMAWWWDPDGTPPGGQSGEGCMRVVRGGARAYPGEWPEGDADLFVETDPCTQDMYKLADPKATDLA